MISTPWINFNSIPDGTRVANNGFDQCVALANAYHQGVLGKPFVAVMSAYQWWTLYEQIPALRDTYTKSMVPVAGAVVVMRGGIYDAVNGHIGVVVEVRADGSFVTMEQNAGPEWPRRYVYRYHRANLADHGVLGFLIPRNNPAAPAPDPITPERVPLMYITLDTNNRPGAKQVVRPGSAMFLEHGDRKTALSQGAGVHILAPEYQFKGKPGTVVSITVERYKWDGKRYTERIHITRGADVVIGPDGFGHGTLPVVNRVPADGSKLGVLATVKGSSPVTVQRFASKGARDV